MTDNTHRPRPPAETVTPAPSAGAPASTQIDAPNTATASVGAAQSALDATAELARDRVAMNQHIPGRAELPGGRMASTATREGLRSFGAAVNGVTIVNGVRGARDAIRTGDTSSAVENVLNVGAGGTGLAAGMAPALAPVAAGASMFASGYGVGHLMNSASGEAMEYLGIGGMQTRHGRGTNDVDQRSTDNRNVSDRLADATRTDAGDEAARGMSQYLPTILGGEGQMVRAEGGVRDGTAHPIDFGPHSVDHKEPTATAAPAEDPQAREQRMEMLRQAHPELRPSNEPYESSAERARRVQRELDAANHRHRPANHWSRRVDD